MNQRYDLFAFSLLMFAAILLAWLVSMPMSLDIIARWQTLIGGVFTFTGIVVASWNVTRQMKLAARSREQDRIEREVPGLRSAYSFTQRFEFLVKNDASAKRILDEFSAVGLLELTGPDFAMAVEKLLPAVPDFSRRQMIYSLFKLLIRVERLQRRELAYENEKRAYDLAKLDRRDLKLFQSKLSEAENDRSVAKTNFETARSELLTFREELFEKIKSERKRGDALRSQHDKYLDL